MDGRNVIRNRPFIDLRRRRCAPCRVSFSDQRRPDSVDPSIPAGQHELVLRTTGAGGRMSLGAPVTRRGEGRAFLVSVCGCTGPRCRTLFQTRHPTWSGCLRGGGRHRPPATGGAVVRYTGIHIPDCVTADRSSHMGETIEITGFGLRMILVQNSAGVGGPDELEANEYVAVFAGDNDFGRASVMVTVKRNDSGMWCVITEPVAGEQMLAVTVGTGIVKGGHGIKATVHGANKIASERYGVQAHV